MLESNKCGSLTKTIMYLMQMQIAYCYIYIGHCVFVLPIQSLIFGGEYMLLEDVLYGLNLCCVLYAQHAIGQTIQVNSLRYEQK